MKVKKHTGFAKHILGVSIAAALAACGGGGDSGQPSAGDGTTPTTPTITGKAIDGYLAGATVCLDVNNNGVCDTGEPSAITDATGQFAISYSGDATGKTLLVQVTPATKDLSRPAGFQFPASFTLSRVVQSSANQVVTPLTALVTAQMQAGLSQTQAISAVQGLLGSQVDPNADYVAGNDTATQSRAARVVDKLGAFATHGAVDAATVRNALNAMVAKGDIASVTQDDVAAQATKPVYQLADASQVLATPTYSFVDYLISFFGGFNPTPGSTNQALVRDVRQIVGSTLQTRRQENLPAGSDTWSDVGLGAYNGGKYDGLAGEYVLKADGTWSDFITEPQRLAPLPLARVGTTLSGTDPTSGFGFTYETRSVDVSGQPLSIAAPAAPGFYDFAHAAPLTGTAFPSGTTAYLGIQTYSADRIVLPVSVPMCDNAAIQNGVVCGAVPAYMDGSTIVMTSGRSGTTYTSIQQAIGAALVGQNVGLGSIDLSADHRATIDNTPATWSVYPGNANVLVFEFAASDMAALAAGNGRLQPLASGAKLVLALRNGRLQIGWLYPSTYADKALQFPSGLPTLLMNALNAVVAAPH
ncbi:hypothetical protein [Burkholderia ubonensis]|uniref:hypothetical protein n=1 Tax=Burkholderia ubonensis TaxID=101571 RepID=UPI000F55D03C|nr:hypothetical protein [Burkholderia ubonensis]RQP34148.1 hypothetical protein DF155_15800 [Burkholderia ubonensis]RQP40406.1 hypothetical protein DF154_13810 [Burkholderia ubonensis]RQP40545.1 hypothetical protein DF156_16250 [Burkholderia ubonensis]RQP53939.1 hypothetical protein DF144_16145 [Burkholderia ubonensis]RQP57421.1 hypothetical protein DF159_22345 [Burkholderia ubonensis]